jgi:preprotein translocase subunit YajC
MSGRTIGNLILMTLICVVVFIVFMAVRPTKASAHNFQTELSDLARPYYPATVLDLISPEAVTCS